MKDNRYIVPNGIRPVMVRTGIEVSRFPKDDMHKFFNSTLNLMKVHEGAKIARLNWNFKKRIGEYEKHQERRKGN